MEVDYIGKGGKKGKKGKSGKDGGKNNTQRETRTCHICGKQGHIATDCWRRSSSSDPARIRARTARRARRAMARASSTWA
eukprot:8122677-Alexandrium_andersonii.AAC.1